MAKKKLASLSGARSSTSDYQGAVGDNANMKEFVSAKSNGLHYDASDITFAAASLAFV